jgi:hypothetical protein
VAWKKYGGEIMALWNKERRADQELPQGVAAASVGALLRNLSAAFLSALPVIGTHNPARD